jgi:hypothetical protein
MPSLTDVMRGLERLHDQHTMTNTRELQLNELQHRFDYACTTGQEFYGDTRDVLEQHLKLFLAHKNQG